MKDETSKSIGYLDYSFMLSEDKPITDPTPTDAQKAATQVSIDKWDKINKMNILIIKSSMDLIMFGRIPEKKNAKDLLVIIKHQFEGSVKGRQYNGVYRNFQTSFRLWSCFRLVRNFLCAIFEA